MWQSQDIIDTIGFLLAGAAFLVECIAAVRILREAKAERPRTDPDNRWEQLVLGLGSSTRWLGGLLAGALLGAIAGAAAAPDSDREAEWALQTLGLGLALATQVYIIYLTWVFGSSVWRAGRALRAEGRLKMLVPRWSWDRPGFLTMMVVGFGAWLVAGISRLSFLGSQ